MADIQITPSDITEMSHVMSDLSELFISLSDELSTLSNAVGLAAADSTGAARAIEKGAFETFHIMSKACADVHKLCAKSSRLLDDYVTNLTALDEAISGTIATIGKAERGVVAGAGKFNHILGT